MCLVTKIDCFSNFCFRSKIWKIYRFVLTDHKEVCLSINGAQSVKLEKAAIEFKWYFKQIPAPFKIYADFECNLKDVETYEGSYSKKYQKYISCNFAYKVICIDGRFVLIMIVSQLLFLGIKMLLMNLI